ncbi:hypothetical protein ENBRE01_3004 [Enteropsectra breve]|nr:hypothetical protein ENBRE01_3004 [Enteropsectra breve]
MLSYLLPKNDTTLLIYSKVCTYYCSIGRKLRPHCPALINIQQVGKSEEHIYKAYGHKTACLIECDHRPEITRPILDAKASGSKMPLSIKVWLGKKDYNAPSKK